MCRSPPKEMSLSVARNISSRRRSVSSPDERLRRELKIRRAAEVFFSILEVFHLVMKHCVECLILLLKQSVSSDFQTLISLVFSL